MAQGYYDPNHRAFACCVKPSNATGDTLTFVGVNPGPYSSLPGKTLVLGTGTTQYTYKFKEGDFADPHAGTAAEVVTALTAWTATIAALSGGTIATTGTTAVRVTWAGPAAGAIKVFPGTANEELGFGWNTTTLANLPAGATTGFSVTFADTSADFWAYAPQIDCKLVAPATWAVTYTEAMVSNLTNLVLTPSATGAVLLATTSNAVGQCLITMRW